MTYQVSVYFSGFLGLFSGMVSVNYLENIIIECSFSRPFQGYIMSLLLRNFSLSYQVPWLILGFLGFSTVRFRLMFLKITSLDTTSQDLWYGILYFSVAQKFVEFVIFTCLRIFGKYFDLRKGEIRNLEWKYGKIWKFYWVQCFSNGPKHTLTT